jgi:hypothetical protein
MPIFVKKFSPKLSAPRESRPNIGVPKIEEDINDFRKIKIGIDENSELRFVDGVWIGVNNGKESEILSDVSRIKKKAAILEQENQMYQAKIDILLDLLTENISELNAIKKAEN